MRKTREPQEFNVGKADILISAGYFDVSRALQFWLVLPQYLAEDEKLSSSGLVQTPAPREYTRLISETFVEFRHLPDRTRVPLGADPWAIASSMRTGKSLRHGLICLDAENFSFKVASNYTLAFSSDGRPIAEVCGGHPSFFRHDALADEAACELDGTYFNLCVPYGHNNYSHFLLDRIPRLEWIKDWREPINILFDAEAMNFAEPFFRDAGSRATLIPIERNRVYRIGQARMFSMAGHPLQTGAPEYVAFIRSLVVDWSSKKATRRLIIHRNRGRRGIANEEEFYEFMGTLGYEIVRLESLTIMQQLALLSEACVVVAVHGAGLSNIVTCRPGAVVIEILPNTYYTPAFAITAQTTGLQYFPYLEMSERNLQLATRQQFSDTMISLDKWKRFLHMVDSEARKTT
jgi:hypothetical protein